MSKRKLCDDLVLPDDHAAKVETMRQGIAMKATLGILRRLMQNSTFESGLEKLFHQI
jgi:hypothetical protein